MASILCKCRENFRIDGENDNFTIRTCDILKLEEKIDKRVMDFDTMAEHIRHEQYETSRCPKCKRLYMFDPEANRKAMRIYKAKQLAIFDDILLDFAAHSEQAEDVQVYPLDEPIDIVFPDTLDARFVARLIEHKRKNARCVLVQADFSIEQMEEVARTVASKPNCVDLMLLLQSGDARYTFICPDSRLSLLPDEIARGISEQPANCYHCRCGKHFSIGFGGPNDYYTIPFDDILELGEGIEEGATTGDSMNTFYANNAHLTFRCPECLRIYMHDTQDGQEVLYVYEVEELHDEEYYEKRRKAAQQ